MFGQVGGAGEVPWAEVWGTLGWCAVVALVVAVAYMLVMWITARRFLAGGLLEARLLAVLLRHGWALVVVLVAPAVAAFRSQQPAAAALLALAALIFVLLSIPPINHFFRDTAVVGRLGRHFWSRRSQIERAQSKHSAGGLGEEAGQLKGEAEEAELSQADRQLQKKIADRFAVARLAETALFRTGYEWEDVLKSAGREAGPGLFEYTSMMMSGRYASIPSGSPLATPGTFLLLLLWALAGSLTWSAGQMAWGAGVDLRVAFLVGLALGIAALSVPPSLHRWRRSRWVFPCLVCEKRTRRQVPVGSVRPHLCGEDCEKTLRRMY